MEVVKERLRFLKIVATHIISRYYMYWYIADIIYILQIQVPTVKASKHAAESISPAVSASVPSAELVPA